MPTNEATFNTGMELLLETVCQLSDYLKKEFKIVGTKDINFYAIEKGKINRQSIKFSFDALEQWTRACKFLLIQLQRINLVISMKDEQEQINQQFWREF